MKIAGHRHLLAAGLAVGMALGGCEGTEAGRALGQGLGAGIGAVLGGVIGNRFGSGAANTIATAAGASLGAYFGSQAFSALSEGDRELARRTQAHALDEAPPAGRTSSWRNPDTGSGGEVTVDQARTRDGQQCRNFVHAIKARNESAPLQAEGLACRQADGSWTVFGS